LTYWRDSAYNLPKPTKLPAVKPHIARGRARASSNRQCVRYPGLGVAFDAGNQTSFRVFPEFMAGLPRDTAYGSRRREGLS
ncbi:MAG TPA: hypothetical protein VNL35_19015, partial [Chloroflexota bacterium]|nr:hypothetical protein [Chloroflexota bacterium]